MLQHRDLGIDGLHFKNDGNSTIKTQRIVLLLFCFWIQHYRYDVIAQATRALQGTLLNGFLKKNTVRKTRKGTFPSLMYQIIKDR